MSARNFRRRKFIASLLIAAPCAVLADGRFVEPDWLKVRHVKVGSATSHRLVHFSDLHHKGDRSYLESVVQTINGLTPDFVCFTGDIIEDAKYLPEALEILSSVQAPMFGVPGNHDFWSRVQFAPIQKCFAANGGAWLMDQHREIAGGRINLIGLSCLRQNVPITPDIAGAKHILLMHYPAWVKKIGARKFDLMLAGHSHGGQVRVPFYGPIVVPFNVDEYDMGLFQTPAGPLYVNPGIGYLSRFEFRFNCRPEITVIEV